MCLAADDAAAGVEQEMVPTAYRSVMLRPGKRSTDRDNPTLRRLLDVFVSLLLLLVLSPVFVAVCLAIALTSRGWPVYRQKRVGRDGRLFKICKFRTMHVGADRNGPSVTSADDSRVTPIGRRLRDYKLDELPQFVNVFLGDMSLVGPRPQVPHFVEHFDSALRHVVLAVRPGITGPTTLHFRHEEDLLADKPNREDYYIQQILPTKLAMDVHYVQNRSLGEDLRVLVDTIRIFMIALARRVFVHQARPSCEKRVHPETHSLGEYHPLESLDAKRHVEAEHACPQEA